MTSNNKAGWRRMTAKTHGTFETIPSLRVPGKEPHAPTTAPRKQPNPRKPPQYADPTLFPGRRLDRRHPSTLSVISGHSGLSGLDQTTHHGSGRFRGAGSTAGSTKLSHASVPAVGAARNPLPDGSDPWGSARPNADDNALAALRKATASEDDARSGSARALPPTLSFSKALPQQSSFAKVSRWQHANFTHTVGKAVPFEARETLFESPTSVVSDDSQLQPPLNENLVRKQESRIQEQEEEEKAEAEEEDDDMWVRSRLRYTPSPPKGPGQHREGERHINPHRRPAHTPAVSPTPPSGPGPRLNKILWALAPDEHANMSETGISHKQSTCRDTYTTDRPVARPLHKTVTVTDLEVASDTSCQVPETPRNPHLTEELLMDHNQTAKWSADDRIYQWLADCDKETTSQSLPTHLPDIQYTFKFLKSAT